MKKVKLIIELDEDLYKAKIQGTTSNRQDRKILECVKNGTQLEEISNPCIECSQNCCVCELNGEKCECQKVYVVKENKE